MVPTLSDDGAGSELSQDFDGKVTIAQVDGPITRSGQSLGIRSTLNNGDLKMANLLMLLLVFILNNIDRKSKHSYHEVIYAW